MIGEVIKEARVGAEMTARELAKRSGVSASRISEQERGLTSLTVDELFKVDSVLDNDVVWALTDYYKGI